MTRFSAVKKIKANTSGATNLNVGMQIICERSEQKILLYPYVLFSYSWNSSGGQNRPPDKLQWGGRPPPVRGNPPTSPPANRALGTLSLVVLTHLIFFGICIGSPLINALNSNFPPWRTTFSTPLNLLIYVLCSIITLPHVFCVLPTPICCRFQVSAQPLPPAVSALQSLQSGTHYPLRALLVAFAVLSLQTPYVASLKLTASSRPTAPSAAQPSASDSATGWQCAL